jgi:protein phosphatase
VIRFAHGSATDVGRVRSLNEDSLLVAESLFAVADGMGGHRGGEVASAEALEALRTSVLEPDAAALVGAVEAANRAVFEHSMADPELAGMGTTLCAVAVVRDDEGAASIAIVNVGDSRVYLLRDGDFGQLTLDHSLVETMVRGGQLSPDEAAVHPGRNVLTRALGIEPEIDVDLFHEPVRPGDRFLLCSDGLFNELHDDQISAVLRRLADPSDAAAELVRLAGEAGGRDNITVVIVDVVEGDGTEAHGPIGTATADRTAPATEDPVGLTTQPTAQVPALGTLPDEPTAPRPARATAPSDAAPVAASSTRVERRRQRRRSAITWRVWLFVAAIVVLAGVVIGVVVAGGSSSSTTTVPAPEPTSSTSSSTSTSSTTPTPTAPVPTTVVSVAPPATG